MISRICSWAPASGPRSYAIIEQGTIARLVESKPEELRVFLEEAAGISKYKERRRETENRIHHTRENIERLNDLRDEVKKQLQHLHRQARAAERYKELNEEKRQVEAELKGLRWRELDEQVGNQDHVIRERESQLEAAVAEQRALESELEKSRQHHDEASDNLNVVQGRYYELGTAIARLEQSLQHIRELRNRQQKDMEELESSWREVEGHINRDQDQIKEAADAIAELGPAYACASKTEKKSAEALAEAERAMQVWQEYWEAFNREASEKSQSAEVGRTRIQHLERQLNQALQRFEKLQQERDGLSADTLQTEIDEISHAVQHADNAREQWQTELAQVARELDVRRDDDQRLAKELHALRSALEDHRGRVASLEALQQAALGKSRAQVTEWLKARHLAGNPRLAELISVASGWERAVETVLGYHLEAVCIEEFNEQAAEFASLAGGSLSFVEKATSQNAAGAGSLLSKITSPVPLEGLLGQVRVAENLEAALTARPRLAASESVITRDGIWLGRHWLRVIRDQDERAGVLAREQELKQHKVGLAKTQNNLDIQSRQQESVRRQLKELEVRREELQAEANRAHRQHADTLARLKTAHGRLEQLAQRVERLNDEIGEHNAQIKTTQAELKAARGQMEAALDAMHSLESRRPALQQEREKLRAGFEETRSRAKSDGEAMHDIALKLESHRSLRESTQQNLSRMQTQLTQMETRRAGLLQAMQDAVTPTRRQEMELNGLLGKRTSMDTELAEARRRRRLLRSKCAS